MDREEEYEPEQEYYNEDPDYLAEGEDVDYRQLGAVGSEDGDPHGLKDVPPGLITPEQYMYLEQESQDEVDAKAVVEDIESKRVV